MAQLQPYPPEVMALSFWPNPTGDCYTIHSDPSHPYFPIQLGTVNYPTVLSPSRLPWPGAGVVTLGRSLLFSLALSLLSTAAWAQGSNVSSEEIMGYARSVLEMDGPRNAAYNEIKALLTGTNYDVAALQMRCGETPNLNPLPRRLRRQVRSILVNYCNQASDIVRANGLRVDQFNAITSAYPEDPTLAEQIRTVLMQLQQQTPSQPSQVTP